ncbi:MAG TPA: hypothetical protein GXX38_07500 [Clostridia bacterium]|jgi:DNA polymerase III delta subunit|nr:hypothetical protein [Clostridia bacterium]
MDCYDCGNCRSDEPVYFCSGRNEFIINETKPQIRERTKSNWKKGEPNYELRRRRIKQESDSLRGIS